MKSVLALLLVILATAAAAILQEPIAILSQEQDISPDGSFKTKWTSANGIAVQEEGILKNLGQKDEAQAIKGAASWTSPEGTAIQLSWVADENGANFRGAHLPVSPLAPEIPPVIQKALDWIATHPYVEPKSQKN